MSVSNSLANALTGLNAAARRAEIVSSNISNALTEGYGRRELSLASQSVGGRGAGVRVTGVTRLVDIGIIQDRRLADAGLGDAQTRVGFLERIERITGSPDTAGSLSQRLAQMASALTEAASRPDSQPRLQNVLSTAMGLARHIGNIAGEVQASRMDADQAIGAEVDRLNNSLRRVRDLNVDIAKQRASGHDATALMDQRQQTIDQISELVPIRQVPRDNGAVALFTTGGAVLLDGKAAEIGFSPAGIITPDMTLGSGALSGLTVNGSPLDTATASSPLAGGTLIAAFAIRDELAPTAQTRIDAVARNLVERFQSPSVDPTLAPTDAGLFTDQGLFFDPPNEEGLALRLQVNAAADPAQGGAVWRLRDGIGATAPGDVGNAAGLQRLTDALTGLQAPVSGGFSGNARSASGLASDFLSLISTARQGAEADATFARVQSDTFRGLELQNGVDTDHEMQQLLLIESAYAANARVIQTVDEMIQTLLGL